jgi:hypothetical protein
MTAFIVASFRRVNDLDVAPHCPSLAQHIPNSRDRGDIRLNILTRKNLWLHCAKAARMADFSDSCTAASRIRVPVCGIGVRIPFRRSSAWMTEPSTIATSRSRQFLSWGTLPGQEYSHRMRMAASATCLGSRRCRIQACSRKWATRSGRSSRLSRSVGIRSGTTLEQSEQDRDSGTPSEVDKLSTSSDEYQRPDPSHLKVRRADDRFM